jgi:hypothetical protein
MKTTVEFETWAQCKKALNTLKKKVHQPHVESIVYVEVGPKIHRLEVIFKKIPKIS